MSQHTHQIKKQGIVDLLSINRSLVKDSDLNVATVATLVRNYLWDGIKTWQRLSHLFPSNDFGFRFVLVKYTCLS